MRLYIRDPFAPPKHHERLLPGEKGKTGMRDVTSGARQSLSGKATRLLGPLGVPGFTAVQTADWWESRLGPIRSENSSARTFFPARVSNFYVRKRNL